MILENSPFKIFDFSFVLNIFYTTEVTSHLCSLYFTLVLTFCSMPLLHIYPKICYRFFVIMTTFHCWACWILLLMLLPQDTLPSCFVVICVSVFFAVSCSQLIALHSGNDGEAKDADCAGRQHSRLRDAKLLIVLLERNEKCGVKQEKRTNNRKLKKKHCLLQVLMLLTHSYRFRLFFVTNRYCISIFFSKIFEHWYDDKPRKSQGFASYAWLQQILLKYSVACIVDYQCIETS